MNRLDTPFGNDDLPPGSPTHQGNLQAFGATYQFNGRTWSITLWQPNWPAAAQYCRAHGLKLAGKITETTN